MKRIDADKQDPPSPPPKEDEHKHVWRTLRSTPQGSESVCIICGKRHTETE